MVDLLIVGGYFAFLLAVGWRARGGSADAYWVGARRYGVFPVSASLVATIFGASSTVGIIGLGYSRGLTGAWWALVGGIALIPFSFFLAERVRNLGVYTLPDILHEAYGGRVSVLGAGIIGVAWCGVVAAQIVAGALLLGSVLAMEFQAALAGVTLVFVLYTLWGGQLSVIRTDSWQIFLFLGALLATLFLVVKSGAASGALLADAPQGHLGFPVSSAFGWYQVVVFYPLIVGMPYLVGPDVYSRILCAKDSVSARKAALWAALAVIPLSFLLAGLGLLIRIQFPGLTPEEALPSALSALAPAGVKGLIVVGILGAIMSSADTTLISASTIFSLNVVGPLVGLDERGRLRLTRGLVVILGLVAWGIASFQREIIASLLLSYTVFVGGVAIPTLASFWRDRLGITSTGAFWAVLAGGLTALLGGVGGGVFLNGTLGKGGTEFLEMVLGPEYGSILPVLISAFVLLGVSKLSRRRGSGAD
jgi:SSS family solute:Na+ symporter